MSKLGSLCKLEAAILNIHKSGAFLGSSRVSIPLDRYELNLQSFTNSAVRNETKLGTLKLA